MSSSLRLARYFSPVKILLAPMSFLSMSKELTCRSGVLSGISNVRIKINQLIIRLQ
jgi:hypothetical protein